ncbi:hypothetical protein [uncultured Fretibacterium sp.]|uniref:hypothetical protein n=1 Tax=uncultured Fretibacterium sp. TaxID=1678694 RepID=UPI002614B7CB|nr:hypothetical protein [uncultured Fretibacterium sp.]
MNRNDSGRNHTESPLWWIVFLFVCILLLLPGRAPALAASAAEDLLRLAGKLSPGMTAKDAEDLLGPPAETAPVGGGTDLLRSSWLHGEMGIEIYLVKDAVYRVDLSRRFERNIDLLRAMDDLTRQGQRKYGSMPRFDTGRNEYYWIAKGHRFSFSRYTSGTIRVCLSGE